MKSGLLAFGALISAAPLYAQASPDPLAPLSAPPQPSGSAPSTEPSAPQQPIVVTQVAPPANTVVVPKDWRGVFDAIDAGNWASAQAGIATLPRSILTPVAKAELYTAKGSPVVDLASLQALLAEAPELPQSDQLAAMAVRRGALTPPLIMTLSHSTNNDFVDSATDDPVHHGLTPFGRAIVHEMNRLGMMIDISHVQADVGVAAFIRIPDAARAQQREPEQGGEQGDPDGRFAQCIHGAFRR